MERLIYTQEELNEIYESLPSELQEALFSVSTSDLIWRAAQVYQLKEAQIPLLAEETGHVLMGLIHPDDFDERLMGILEIDVELSRKISRQINRDIFFPLRSSIAKIYRSRIGRMIKEKPISEEKEEVKKAEFEEFIEVPPSAPAQKAISKPPPISQEEKGRFVQEIVSLGLPGKPSIPSTFPRPSATVPTLPKPPAIIPPPAPPISLTPPMPSLIPKPSTAPSPPPLSFIPKTKLKPLADIPTPQDLEKMKGAQFQKPEPLASKIEFQTGAESEREESSPKIPPALRAFKYGLPKKPKFFGEEVEEEKSKSNQPKLEGNIIDLKPEI